MRITRDDISKLFQNDKVGEVFSNSEGGQGLILVEIEKLLTFEDLDNLKDIVNSLPVMNFMQQNSTYPNIVSFIKKLQLRTDELNSIYRFSKSRLKIEPLIIQNKKKIIDMYPSSTENESLILFVQKYKQVQKEIYYKTYSTSQDFFYNPIDYLKNL